MRAVAHGDFKEAFLHTEGKAGASIAALSSWKDGVMVSQVALQMMANMLASQDEDEEDDEGWEEDEEGDDEHGPEGAGSGWMEDAAARPVPGDMAAWIASSGLLERVGHHCHVPFELSHSQLAHTRSCPSDICPALAELQVTALDCLCNWMAAAPPGSEETLVRIRDGVLVAGAAASSRLPTPLQEHERAVEEALSAAVLVYLEKSVSVCQGAAGAAGAEAGKVLLTLPPETQEALARWARTGETETIRCNALGALGTLGKTLRDGESNRAIATLLLQAAQAASSVTVAAEALNAIFDAYSEDDLNESVMRPLNMLQCLLAIQAPFAAAAKQWLLEAKAAARKDASVKMRAARLSEVRANLPRFIKYKKEMGL